MTEINLSLLSLSLVEDSFEQQGDLERRWQSVGIALLFLKLGRCDLWARSDFSFLRRLSDITYTLGLFCPFKMWNLTSTSLPWPLNNDFFVFCFSFLLFFFKFYFIFKLYIIVLVLPNIKMNPPQVYMFLFFWAVHC